MKIICHDDKKFSSHFSFGAKAPLMNLYEQDLRAIKSSGYTAVVTGLGRLKLISKFEELGIPYFFLDRAYIFGERKFWIRVSYNSLQMNEMRDIKGWRNVSPVTPEPWRKGGSKIVVCPPSKKTSEFYKFDKDKWLNRVVKYLDKNSDREVIIRYKPDNKIARYHGDTSLLAALEDAHCIVVYNSNAATEAIFSGVPAIVLGDAASKFVARTDLSDIESLCYPDRELWLKNLFCNQFTVDELSNGEAIDFLTKYHRIT